MKVQPRQQLLEIWQALARPASQKSEWSFQSRDPSNSINDAEQLVRLMYPASTISEYRLDPPRETAPDALRSLRDLGDEVEIPRMVVQALRTFMDDYRNDSGHPAFSAEGHLGSTVPGQRLNEGQKDLGIVDPCSMSIALALTTIAFVRDLREVVRSQDFRTQLDELEAWAGDRLTMAMICLLRSFTAHAFAPDSAPGPNLLGMLDQHRDSPRLVFDDLSRALREIRTGLRDLSLSNGGHEVDRPDRLFECGWGWGIVEGAPEMPTWREIGPQPAEEASDHPHLYFTVIALEGVADLFSERTVIQGLLNEEQVRSAQELRLRRELTQRYQAVIGSYGQRWPLEEIPWRVTEGSESDCCNLLLTSIVIQNFHRDRVADVKLKRICSVLGELAQRGRITRRVVENDPVVQPHHPGLPTDLVGSEKLSGPRLRLQVADFAPLPLKRALQVAGMLGSTGLGERILELSDEVWEHHAARRLASGPFAGLWDRPSNLFGGPDQCEFPSWHYTERVIKSLFVAAQVQRALLLRSPDRSCGER